MLRYFLFHKSKTRKKNFWAVSGNKKSIDGIAPPPARNPAFIELPATFIQMNLNNYSSAGSNRRFPMCNTGGCNREAVVASSIHN